MFVYIDTYCNVPCESVPVCGAVLLSVTKPSLWLVLPVVCSAEVG